MSPSPSELGGHPNYKDTVQLMTDVRAAKIVVSGALSSPLRRLIHENIVSEAAFNAGLVVLVQDLVVKQIHPVIGEAIDANGTLIQLFALAGLNYSIPYILQPGIDPAHPRECSIEWTDDPAKNLVISIEPEDLLRRFQSKTSYYYLQGKKQESLEKTLGRLATVLGEKRPPDVADLTTHQILQQNLAIWESLINAVSTSSGTKLEP